ncbi:MAG: hypothetical protein K2K57_08575 [Oscillospiraceae bacterium]|nr:hypothetical protein [Oscillospiraceae bacterium]
MKTFKQRLTGRSGFSRASFLRIGEMLPEAGGKEARGRNNCCESIGAILLQTAANQYHAVRSRAFECLRQRRNLAGYINQGRR